MHSNDDGYMYELCAGIIDKNIPIKQIVKEEILEECGYDVAVEQIEYITTFFPCVGTTGAKQSLFYAQIDESMHTGKGGGIHDEAIEVIYLPLEESKKFMFDEHYQKTPGMMMAFYWFFEKEGWSAPHSLK